jgi:hypothetical protein
MGIESDSAVPFLDVLIIRKGMALATNVVENPPTLADTSNSNIIILPLSKEE